MSEEQIAGEHGDRNELQMRLHRMLERATDDSPRSWRALWSIEPGERF